MNRHLVHANYREDWSTPWSLFERWDREFRFELDAAASLHNAKCPRFWSRKENGLAQPWAPLTTWLNPPYGKDLDLWVRKALIESLKGATVVALLPASIDTRWFHESVFPHVDELRLIRGRVSFDPPPGRRASTPANGSVLAVYRPSRASRRRTSGPRVVAEFQSLEAGVAAGHGGT